VKRLRAVTALMMAGTLCVAQAAGIDFGMQPGNSGTQPGNTGTQSGKSSNALDTDKIVQSCLSTDCLDYKVVGVCFWLLCTNYGCSVRTSIKVRHYVPDAVVSSYANTGENPWEDVKDMSRPNDEAQGGRDGTTNHQRENNLARFKNADVIGHPGGEVFSQFADGFGYTCKGAGTAFFPYFLSTLDSLAWRSGIPESLYLESSIPGLREVSDIFKTNDNNSMNLDGLMDQLNSLFDGKTSEAGNADAGNAGTGNAEAGTTGAGGAGNAEAGNGMDGTGILNDSQLAGNIWGSVYPRMGFLHQSDDYKAAAVIAQRAGDVVTRKWQVHVYWPLVADAKDGYWPAGELKEGDASTGKWQELLPTQSDKCAVFPHKQTQKQASKGDYAWALWRPYACCERKGQIFLFSVDTETSGSDSGAGSEAGSGASSTGTSP
jgi:hypothetical protein